MWQVFIPVVLISTLVMGIVVASVVHDAAAVRRWVTVALTGIAAFPVSIVLHNVLSAVFGGEEMLSFIVALLVAPGFIAIGTLAVAVTLARDARFAQVGRSLVLGGAGVALFALYALFGPAVTALAGGDPRIQAAIEAIVLPLSATALALGAALAVLARLRPPATVSSSGGSLRIA